MSSQKTTNLNLHKWIGTDNVKRIEFNENWDTIDAQIKGNSDKIGALSGLQTSAKTNTVAAINEVNTEINSNDIVSVTKQRGTSSITSIKNTPVNVLSAKGKTLVNLLGADGNDNTLKNWAVESGVKSFFTSTATGLEKYGRKALKSENPTGTNYVSYVFPSKTGSNYIAVGEFNVSSYTSGAVSIRIGQNDAGNTIINNIQPSYTTLNTWQTKSFRFTAVGEKTEAWWTSTAGTHNIGMLGLRVYEITQAEFDALATMTEQQIAEKYPYVDSVKGVSGIAIENTTNGSYNYIQETFHSNQDGTIYDELFRQNGKLMKRKKFKEVVLDGSLAWAYQNDYTGFKRVSASVASGSVNDTGRVVKYDGKILTQAVSWDGFDKFNGDLSSGTLHATIADTDSGWGETYTPSSDEIKAYFNGYRHSAGYYFKIKPDGTAETTGWNITTALNEPNTLVGRGRLFYQLATPIEEEVKIESNLRLSEGVNNLDLKEGVVVRELAYPVEGGGSFVGTWYLNDINNPSSAYLKNRALKILDIQKNGKSDLVNWTVTAVNAYGTERASSKNFDKTATYTVTYLAEPYAFSSPVQSITSEYGGNVKSVLDMTVDKTAENSKNIEKVYATLNAQKAERKTSQWFDMTLQNGWLNYGNPHSVAGFRKDDNGVVHVRGLIKTGTTTSGTTIATLPDGFRPTGTRNKSVNSTNGSTGSPGRVSISSAGDIKTGEHLANTWLILDFSFETF
jgi:hypothetical protein